MRRYMPRRPIKRLLADLTSGSEAARWEAARQLPDRGGWRLRQRLEWIATRHPDAPVREAATYALGFRHDARAVPTLVRTLGDENETPTVRGQAAESLAYMWDGAQQAKTAVIAGLRSEEPEVRFWCCFAAASLGLKEALPILEQMAATDDAELPRWWPVATEALWAVKAIRGDPAADDVLDEAMKARAAARAP